MESENISDSVETSRQTRSSDNLSSSDKIKTLDFTKTQIAIGGTMITFATMGLDIFSRLLKIKLSEETWRLIAIIFIMMCIGLTIKFIRIIWKKEWKIRYLKKQIEQSRSMKKSMNRNKKSSDTT